MFIVYRFFLTDIQQLTNTLADKEAELRGAVADFNRKAGELAGSIEYAAE